LDALPDTLAGIYEQTLRGIDKEKRDYAYRLFQCLVVAKRPLRVEELAEFFAAEPDADSIPIFDATLRPDNPEEYVLSTCSTLVVVVNVDGKRIVQFSHFSVREYLMSKEIARSKRVCRFHVLPRPAHAFFASACLGVLLQLDGNMDGVEVEEFPLASYAAQHWVEHAQFEDVSSDVQDGMELLFDKNESHFTAWLQLYNIDDPFTVSMATTHSSRTYPVPLYYAALCGFRDIAERLVGADPGDVNAQGGKRVTPLHAALDKGHLSVAELLVECDADMGSRDSWSRTPLHTASHRGYTDTVSLLINRGADLDVENDRQETALYLASKKGRQEVARLLLKYKADTNRPDVHGWTPLHVASREGHDHVVLLLLNHGVDANHLDSHGSASLHVASREGRIKIVRLLLDHRADANQSDSHGSTSLHIASREGRSDIVQLLLDRGANSDHPDSGGLTPLHVASQRGRKEIVELLLERGTDANHSDDVGWTPLHLASWESHNDVARSLPNGFLNINSEPWESDTSLHSVSSSDRIMVITALLEHGRANVDAQNMYWWTPLHVASRGGNLEIVQRLLEGSADVNAQAMDGSTPLHVAAFNGDLDVVELLLKNGGDPHTLNEEGDTPFQVASRKKFEQVARLLSKFTGEAVLGLRTWD